MSRNPSSCNAVRRLLALCATLLAILALPAGAEAASKVGNGRNLGIGIEGGRGPGLSIKYFGGPKTAYQFGLSGSSYGYKHRGYGKYGYESGLGWLHADLLSHGPSLVNQADFELPWYAGGGIDLGLGGDVGVGVHGNLGVALQLNAFPIDVFVEWIPTLWVVGGFGFDFGRANGGLRFYL